MQKRAENKIGLNNTIKTFGDITYLHHNSNLQYIKPRSADVSCNRLINRQIQFVLF